jgi:hypothetical protein
MDESIHFSSGSGGSFPGILLLKVHVSVMENTDASLVLKVSFHFRTVL